MTTHKIKGKYEFVCDDCGEVLSTDERDFHGALDVLRSEGWRSVRDGNDWVHFCRPECKSVKT